MNIAGVIIAGGQSSRMGSEKALLDFAGEPLVARIARRISPHVQAMAVNANGGPSRFAFLGHPVIADTTQTGTPLAGLLTALEWAAQRGCSAVVTAPSDTPFLPPDFVTRLIGETAAIAASRQPHYVCGFWPIALLQPLRQAAGEGSLGRMKDWAALAQARTVTWPTSPYDPFFNLNTAEDLAAARRIAGEFPEA